MNLGLGKKYGTPTKQLSAADQLLLLKFNSFLDAVRERNKTFHIPVTKEDKEMVAIRPLSPKTQMDTVSAIRRFHGWECKEKKKKPGDVSLRNLLMSDERFCKFCYYLYYDRKYQIG